MAGLIRLLSQLVGLFERSQRRVEKKEFDQDVEEIRRDPVDAFADKFGGVRDDAEAGMHDSNPRSRF